MNIIPKRKQPFLKEGDVVEGSSDILRKKLVGELRENGQIDMAAKNHHKDLHEIRVVLGQLFCHDFLYSQLHQLDNFTLSRTFYKTKKFDEYVNSKRENEIM